MKYFILTILVFWGCSMEPTMKVGQTLENIHTGRLAELSDIINVSGAANPVYVLNGDDRWDSDHIQHWKFYNKPINTDKRVIR